MKKDKESPDNLPAQRRWTRQATLCYYLGFNCKKCDVPEDFKRRCRMKATVLDLVRELGKPSKRFVKMIKAELDGELIPEKYYILGEEEDI